MANKLCPTKLLSDIPSEIDEFTDQINIGPHKRLANAIKAMILDEEEVGGKAIGLEGSYGSGKSTVIEILMKAEELKKKIFLFDAWSHKDDPLRRTFLEQLIDFLIEKYISDNKISEEEIKRNKYIEDLNKTKDKLAKRIRITEKRTYPELTKKGIFVLFLLLLLPFADAVYKALSNHQHFWSIPPVNNFPGFLFIDDGLVSFFSSLVLFLPAFIVLIILIIKIFFPKCSKDFEDLVSFFINKSIVNERNETYETPDPTSIEFGNEFNSLMNKALTHTNDSDIILMVLDNLDRVQKEDALTMWSNMRIFIEQCRNKNNSKWSDKLWILVPYEPHDIVKLWNSSNNEEGEGSKDELSRKEGMSLGETFLDKTFEVRFPVPDLVLVDWTNYFSKYIKLAFPAHQDQNDFEDTLSIFHIWNREKDKIPTPREIKLFINNLGALHRQWQDQIPLSHMAYYLLLKKDKRNIVDDVYKALIPTQPYHDVLGDNIENNLLAVTFNVTPEKAGHIFLERRLPEVLLNNDASMLRDFSLNVSFWNCLQIKLSEMFEDHRSNLNTILQITKCLQEANIVTSSTMGKNKKIISSFCHHVIDIKDWGTFDKKKFDGVTSLTKLNPDISFCKKIINKISNTNFTIIDISMENIVEGKRIEKGAKAWIDNLVTYIELLDNLNLTEAIQEGITIPASSAEQFYEIIREISKKSKTNISLSRKVVWSTPLSKEDVSKIIGNIFQEPNFYEFLDNYIELLQNSKLTAGMNSLMNEAYNFFTNPKNSSKSMEIEFALKTLWQFSDKNSEANQRLKQLTEQPQFTLKCFRNVTDRQAKGWCLATLLLNSDAINFNSTPPSDQDAGAGFNDLIYWIFKNPKVYAIPEESGIAIQQACDILKSYKKIDGLKILLRRYQKPSPEKNASQFIIECIRKLDPQSNIIDGSKIEDIEKELDRIILEEK